MADRVELEVASTHRSAAGRASGFRWLDGRFYGPLVACVVIGGGIFFLLMTITGGKAPMMPLIVVGALPTVGLMAYVLVFRRNKPPGYDRDILNSLMFGREFEPKRAGLRHPFDG